MDEHLSQNNQSFGYLHNSAEFLDLIINEITSCIILLDREMKLFAFNDPLKTLFPTEGNNPSQYEKCGNVIGCAHAVEEQKECGKTSHCNSCILREAAFFSYLNEMPINKNKLSRNFYQKGNKKVMKHLQFSTRVFFYKLDKYVVLIIDDITELINQQVIIEEQKGIIIEMSKN